MIILFFSFRALLNELEQLMERLVFGFLPDDDPLQVIFNGG